MQGWTAVGVKSGFRRRPKWRECRRDGLLYSNRFVRITVRRRRVCWSWKNVTRRATSARLKDLAYCDIRYPSRVVVRPAAYGAYRINGNKNYFTITCLRVRDENRKLRSRKPIVKFNTSCLAMRFNCVSKYRYAHNCIFRNGPLSLSIYIYTSRHTDRYAQMWLLSIKEQFAGTVRAYHEIEIFFFCFCPALHANNRADWASTDHSTRFPRPSDIGFRSDNSMANGSPSNYLAELTARGLTTSLWTVTTTWPMYVCVGTRNKKKKKGKKRWRDFVSAKTTFNYDAGTRNPEQLQLVTLNLLWARRYTTEKIVEPERGVSTAN